jgi:hypothetical protein
MSKLVFSAKAKMGYAAAIVVFLVGIAFIVARILSIGCILAGVALGIAFRVAQTNGHMPARKNGGD